MGPSGSARTAQRRRGMLHPEEKEMEWDTLRFETAERDERVGLLVLDRPAVLNAVNAQLIADFQEA